MGDFDYHPFAMRAKSKAPSGDGGKKRTGRPRKRKAEGRAPSGPGRNETAARSAGAGEPSQESPDWVESPLTSAISAAPWPQSPLRLAREQRQRQLQFIREFFTNPSFLEVKTAPVTTSSSRAEIEKRKAEIRYRLDVIEALAAVCRDELDLLSRVKPADAEPAQGDDGGEPPQR